MGELATNSLERGLALMKAIGGKRGGLTNAELSRALAIPKSTCTYILTRLEKDGLVVRNKMTSRYKIGLKTLVLAHDALREIGFHAIAEPALYRLADNSKLVAILGVLEGDRVLTVDRVESPEFMQDAAEAGRSRWPYYPARDQRDIGSELSLQASSIGRVVLAFQPRAEMRALLDKLELTKFTAKTITSKKELLAELKKIRAQGYAITDQQAHLDTLAIAAPIFDRNGEVRAALCVGGSRILPAFDDMPRLIKLVKDAARDISNRMMQPLMLRHLDEIQPAAEKADLRNKAAKAGKRLAS